MNVSFFCNDLTQLRYFVPLVDVAHQACPDWRITCRYDRGNKKYNGLAPRRNWEIFQAVLAARPFVRMERAERNTVCDLFFSVEGLGRDHFECRAHVAIQHGFDYQADLAYRQAEAGARYLMSSADYAEDLRSIRKLEPLVPPAPLCFWKLDDLRAAGRRHLASLGHKGNPVATVFYPDEGHRTEVGAVIAHLKKRGYFVVVKQRRKAQRLPWLLANKVYDDVWYPAEAVYLPAVSNVTIGFGSSAFCDLAPMGLAYIDVRLPHPTYGLPSYVPVSSPSYRIVEKEHFERVFPLIDGLPAVPVPPPDPTAAAADFLQRAVAPLVASSGRIG